MAGLADLDLGALFVADLADCLLNDGEVQAVTFTVSPEIGIFLVYLHGVQVTWAEICD